MARMRTDSISTNLDELIPEYANSKKILDDTKKHCDELGSTIKKTMQEMEINSYTCDGIVAKYIESKRESMDEDLLIQILRKHNITTPIYIKECVDMDKLEDCLYHTDISTELANELDSCRKIQTVVQLRISTSKE